MFSIAKKLIRFFQYVFILGLIFFAGIIIVDTLFPIKYMDMVEKYAYQYDLDPAFVAAMINAESRFNANAVSHKGATGLMQIMPATADWAAQQMQIENFSYDRITEPALNIQMGCWYIARLLNQHDGEINTALAAYNAGSGTVSGWLKDARYSQDGKTLYHIPYAETDNYVRKINLYYRVYTIRLR